MHGADTLTSNSWTGLSSNVTRISVTCYYWAAETSICAGGGDFDEHACGSDTSNDATIIQDATAPPSTHCWYRKNFGLNGIADARQCGVVGDGNATADVATLNNCMTIAAANGIFRIYTGGGVIFDTHSGSGPNFNITPPAGMTLTCGANNAGPVKNDDYRTSIAAHGFTGLANAIVLDLQDTIDLSNDNTAIEGCNVLAGTTDAGSVTNNYSPATWYPACTPDVTITIPCATAPVPPVQYLRSALYEANAFNCNNSAFPRMACTSGGPAALSVGIDVSGDNVKVRDVTVLGFGTCYASGLNGNGKRLVVDHLIGDCDTGIAVNESPDPTEFNGFSIAPYLTRNNMAATTLTLQIVSLVPGGSGYRATVNEGPAPEQFNLKIGDTIWVSTTTMTGAESAGGRWTVGAPLVNTVCGGSACQTFTLAAPICATTCPAATSAAIVVTGKISNAVANGVPPFAVTGIAGTNQSLIAVGQNVSDPTPGLGCIPGGTKVVDVWPARNIVYLSAPATCAAASDTISFSDDGDNPGDCSVSDIKLCLIVDANARFGDALVVRNSGGVSAVNCASLDHVVTFHIYTGANSTRISNCATGQSPTLPDNSFTGLLVDGDHSMPEGDACNTFVSNTVLGQFLPVAVRSNTNCTQPTMLVNTGLATSNARLSGAGLELDAGVVELANSKGGAPADMFVADYPYMIATPGTGYTKGDTLTGMVSTMSGGSCTNVTISVAAIDSAGGVAGYSVGTPSSCSAGAVITSITWSGIHGTGFNSYNDLATLDELDPSRLSISNNSFPKTTLYLENATAAANTAGCGNVFIAPTPYLCTTPLAGSTPDGRLTLCSTPPCPAVMIQGVTGASTVYYVPYVGQQVPIYNPQAASFGMVDIGTAGLSVGLGSTIHVMANLYDVFVETANTGAPELCTGPAWSSSTTRAINLMQIKGVWVNAAALSICRTSPSATFVCPAAQCTYLGTFYATANGQTSQEIGPIAATGGGANCLCLYNGYNRVIVAAVSQDSAPSYFYAMNTWRPMHAGAPPHNNRITVVDGLAQTTISAKLNDALNKNGSLGGPAAMGINFDATTGTPSLIAQNSSTTLGTFEAATSTFPVLGLRYVQAMEDAVGGASAAFGGSGYQQLQVQIED